ncbi:MAG: glycosyltransferase family 4 protein [Acidobacteria bacterium]|nr:glycosyltransferase family 4 protein [Acidobacteriota bacterium]
MEDHPISANAPGGGPATMRNHLELLTGGDVEVALVLLSDPAESFGFAAFAKNNPDEWEQIRRRCASVHIVQLKRIPQTFRSVRRSIGALASPTSYLTSSVDPRTLAELGKIIGEIDPDIVWAENLIPAALAVRAGHSTPVVYSHHDWIWRVWTLATERKGLTRRAQLVNWLMKRGEEALVRQVRGIVSTSTTEVSELQQFNSRVAYIPPAYAPVRLADDAKAEGEARIVHVGGMTTTSNRFGLERFLDVAWPAASAAGPGRPELWVIGSLKDASESLLAKMERAGAVRTGFVEQLTSVLRPYDLHVVPWEHDTGTRMKIPLALSHAQVVVATRITARSLPELIDGQNCVLVDTLEEMGRVIPGLLADACRRRQLGESGRNTFLEHYTYAALQARFNRLVDDWTAQ